MTTTPERRASRPPTALVERLVEFACLAPSVHNTQPWRWRYDGAVLVLCADEERRLPSADPQGRNLAISCGAALHHLQVAAHALGCDALTTPPPADADPDELARVVLHQAPGRPIACEDIELIRARCTDRRRFTAWPVPADRLDQLCRVARAWDVEAVAVLDEADRIRLEVLANQALTSLALDAAGRREQEGWIDRGPLDGIPRDHLPDAPEPMHARSRFQPDLLEDTRLVLRGGDRVIALGTATDDRHSWLRTGQALSAVWLEATRGGISVVPMSQPIEVEGVRHEVARSVLEAAFQPHILLQVGLQAIGRRELPRTPRRPVAEVFEIRLP